MIKKVSTLQEYNALSHSGTESDVTLIEEGNQLMYDGVNVVVDIPKPGDYIYKDADGTTRFVSKDGHNRSLLPQSWTFQEIYYYGWTEDMLVDMGLPSGRLWAKCDIDLSKASKFADTPFVYEKSFFSWGNTDGHNPTSASSFSGSYNWGSVNAQEPWYEGQVYGSTPGAELNASFAADSGYDAARENLGAPWRQPTTAEYSELFANIDYITADGEIVTEATSIAKTAADKRVTVNGINGLYLRSKINGNRLFFACSGDGGGSSWFDRGSNGYFWSSSFSSARYALYSGFYPGGVVPQNYGNRYVGFAVRPVQ